MNDFAFYTEFESLVSEVLQNQGYETEVSSNRRLSSAFSYSQMDILARNHEGVIQPVEVKLTRSESVSLSRLREASSQTATYKEAAVKTKPLLVFNSDIEPSRREWAESEFKIKIWDRDLLLKNSGPLRPVLENFFEKFSQRESSESTAQADLRMQMAPLREFERETEPSPLPHGEALIEKLAAVSAGKKGAKSYESVCREIITYLFGGDLKDVRSQQRTTDDINIYDLIYRVSPRHPFWLTLTRDLRARVVLFECKNYRDPIDAMQVFTTERYLSANAFRPICFVLSRKPPHPHAIQAASGAMRESKKLLVFLSDEDLVKMLRAKDAQEKEGGSEEERQANDPTEILDQIIYDFIAGMPR